jgi:hypothetical protein
LDGAVSFGTAIMRDPNKPIAWIGSDRLLLDDVTPYGLHRYVVANKSEPPDVTAYLKQIRNAGYLETWLIEMDSNGFLLKGWWLLWIIWKEKK